MNAQNLSSNAFCGTTVKKEAEKAAKAAKFAEKQAKLKQQQAAKADSAPKKAKKEKVVEEVLPWVEQTPKGEKKSTLNPSSCGAHAHRHPQFSSLSTTHKSRATTRKLSSQHGTSGGRRRAFSSPS